MLRSYERGFAVMSKTLDSYSFEDKSLETCKKYCREDDVIVEQIPYVNGISIRITWCKYFGRPLHFHKRHREANVFKLHFNWSSETAHRIGKIVYENKK